MNKAEHERSQAITAEATPEPWEAMVENGEPMSIVLYEGEDLIECNDGPHDARFIAHARTALPAYQQALEGAVELLRHAWDDVETYRRVQAFLKRWDGAE